MNRKPTRSTYMTLKDRIAREKKMLILRYDKRFTLQAIGDIFGVCRERVRQIIISAEKRHQKEYKKTVG